MTTDPRTSFMMQLCRGEAKVLKELASSQVTHVPLEEYAPGSERLERLYQAMELANRFQQPSSLEFNL